jgi:hypothetical protein
MLNRNSLTFANFLAVFFSGLIVTNAAFAQVIAVPNNRDGGSPTQTLFWRSADAKATLIFIPGGNGQLGLKPAQTDSKNNFYHSFKSLTEGVNGSHGVNVVLFDSPEALDPAPNTYPWSRATKDHLSRISSVIRFYKQKTGTPIWIMGHSNGAVSVTEFIRFDDPERGPSLLSGLVVSGARVGSRFDEKPLNIPILFLHHEKDGCREGNPDASVKNFEQVKKTNQAPTEFIFITGGASQGRSPCESGYHMYNGSEMQMIDALRGFILSSTP